MSHTYGLIGCGRISKKHIIAAQNSGFKIVAICDINANAANAVKKEHNLSDRVEIYLDYRQLLEV